MRHQSIQRGSSDGHGKKHGDTSSGGSLGTHFPIGGHGRTPGVASSKKTPIDRGGTQRAAE